MRRLAAVVAMLAGFGCGAQHPEPVSPGDLPAEVPWEGGELEMCVEPPEDDPAPEPCE